MTHPIRKTFTYLISTLLIAGCFFAAVQMLYAGKIFPGVTTGDIALSGRTKDDAAKVIAEKAKTLDTLHFTYQGDTFTVSGSDIGLEIDSAATAEAASRVGRSRDFGGLVSGLVGRNTNVPLEVRFNQEALKQKLAEQTQDLGSPVVQANVVRQGGGFRITKEKAGTLVDTSASAQLALLSLGRWESGVSLVVRDAQPDIRAMDLAPTRAYAEFLVNRPLRVVAGDKTFQPNRDQLLEWITFEQRKRTETVSPLDQANILAAVSQIMPLDDRATGIGRSDKTLYAVPSAEKVGQYVATVADEVDSPPVNARLSFAGGQLQIAGQPKDGLVVDRKAAVQKISETMHEADRVATLTITAKQADIRQETLASLGITTLIGSATTTFAGSPGGRSFNIGVGAAKFDGALIKPGEEFSFNQVLGDVGPETGYVPELVILEKRTEKQYGGGLCQVSTTMFRAAMDAGLPITDRTNHSYAVHYYAPIGMDATIYPPNPDLRFKNNTGHNILVQTRKAGVSLTFEFYGTSDGRKSSTEIIHINASEAAGGTASFRYIVEGGPEPINRVFSSSYKPQSAFPISSSLN